MATGYTITIGYNSGYSSRVDDVKAALREAVDKIRSTAYEISNEAARVEGVTIPPDYLLGYRTDSSALTVRVFEEDDELVVFQMASGSGASRKLKEIARRAFCRLVMKAMHAQGIEVCIHVS